MQDNIADIFRAELLPGERIIWTGQPKQGFMLRPGDAIMIPFSLIWGGFAFVWEGAVLLGSFKEGPVLILPVIWGIPFVLIGLYLIIGRFFVDMQQRKRTCYALTDERVLVMSGLFNRSARSVNIRNLSEVGLSLKADGRGTITLGPSRPMSWLAGSGWPGLRRYQVSPILEMIENARQVYQQITQLQRNNR